MSYTAHTAPTNHLLPQGMPGYNQHLTGPDGVSSTAGDKTKAQQLLRQGLQEEGYSSVSALPAISFTFPDIGQDFQNVAEAIVQQWQTVLGVTVQIKGGGRDELHHARLACDSGPRWPLADLVPGVLVSRRSFLLAQYLLRQGGSLNDGNYGQTPEQQMVQQEMVTAATNTNPQQRTQQYNDVEQKIVNDVGWIPLVQEGLDVLINPKVHNLAANGPTRTWNDVYSQRRTGRLLMDSGA